jgi:hypothetical protein
MLITYCFVMGYSLFSLKRTANIGFFRKIKENNRDFFPWASPEYSGLQVLTRRLPSGSGLSTAIPHAILGLWTLDLGALILRG